MLSEMGIEQISVKRFICAANFTWFLACCFRDSQNRELSTLRGRNLELDSELDRIRRQLTAEKFER